MDVIVGHSMQYQERTLEFVCIADRRTAFVCFWILVREAETLARVERVRGVVILPIENWPQGCRCGDPFGRTHCEHSRHETAVAAAVNADPFLIDAVVFYHVVDRVDVIVKVLAAQEIVDIRAPIASVTGGASVRVKQLLEDPTRLMFGV